MIVIVEAGEVVEQDDQIAGQNRHTMTEGQQQGDTAQNLEQLYADGKCRFNLPTAIDLIAPRITSSISSTLIEIQRKHRIPEDHRIWPEEACVLTMCPAGSAKPVIDQIKLNQKRRATENERIGKPAISECGCLKADCQRTSYRK